jgi:Xaa-Pro aminopeptidase
MTNRITSAEFEQRLKNIREQMKQRNLDVLFIYSQKRGHVPYVSGYRPNYHTNSAVVVLPLKGEPMLCVKFAFDLPRAKAVSWFSDIRYSRSESTAKMFVQCAEEIRSLGLDRSRVGTVASDLASDELGISLYEALRTALPHAQLEPASDLMNELRLIKSADEISALRDAAQLAERVAASLGREIKPGQSEKLAAVRATQTARLEGGECDLIISSDSSRVCYPPQDYEFRKGSAVTCEITVHLAGYWVQICRAFSLGPPTNEHREIFEIVRHAHSAAMQKAKPGALVSDVAGAVQGVITASGLKDFSGFGPGHGVGVDLPELYPLDHECHSPLAPGVIMVIHPPLWVANQGAAFVGGPIAITEGGAIALDTPQTEIFEV